jgi:flavin reductase (DIM6/NTAB) family NADH-FMN oxidoreductase RutF
LEPGPVLLLTTAGLGPRARPNVMTLSWHMMMEFEPPLVACLVSGRDDSFELLRASGECVLNIPTAELAPQVVACGNSHGRRRDKFKATGLTPVPASRVGAPLIDECYASLECVVHDAGWVERYNLFVLQVVVAWAAPLRQPRTLHHRGWGEFAVAGKVLKLPSAMK